ncbi:MAG: hypothetical protein PHR77_09840 [Kiritimatiellae bacterium]|nr:hypothetical protein [Kiritimatiellia bacterium]MDD5522598.1 hypothetical protein [Kiritimatiellia bacterium]
MSINFNFNVDRKIIVNGKKYSSVDQLPEDIRRVYEETMKRGGKMQVDVKPPSFKISFNGKDYGSINEMPEAERSIYEKAMAIAGGSVLVNTETTGDIGNLLQSGDRRPSFMKWLFPRQYMEWAEPQEIKDVRYVNQKRIFQKFLPAFIILSFAGIFLLGKLKPGLPVNNLYIAALVVAGIIFMIIYMSKVTTTTISISDRSISMNCGDNADFWNFNEIDHCEISNMKTGGTAPAALVVQTKGGHRKIIGIAPSIKLEDLKLLLESKGVKVS